MATLKDNVHSLNQLIQLGDTIEAMELFYSDDIEMQDNEEHPRQGKRHCIDHEKGVLNRMKIVKSELLNQAIDEDQYVVFSEWQFLITDKDERNYLLKEVSVQKWRDGKVAKEKFYYKEVIKTH